MPSWETKEIDRIWKEVKKKGNGGVVMEKMLVHVWKHYKETRHYALLIYVSKNIENKK